jgi:hypothetical protein
MSVQNNSYFQPDLVHSLVKPLLGGGLVFAYTHFTDKSYNSSMKNHLMAGGIAAGSIALSRIAIGMIPSPSSEGLRSLEHMALQPLMSGVGYAMGKKFIMNDSDLMMNSVIGGASCVISGYMETPIDRFFKV